MKKSEYNVYISVLQIYLTIKFCLVFTCFLFNKKRGVVKDGYFEFRLQF